MSPAFVQRAAVLAAGALLAGVFGLALAQAGRGGGGAELPAPAVSSLEDWTPALAGVAKTAPRAGRPGDCGWLLLPRTQGVIHPVLPCGTRIYLAFGEGIALTRVVAQSPVGDGRQMDVTPRLAQRLGLAGVREIRWTFSR